MITLTKHWEICIPPEEVRLGYEGENEVEIRRFCVPAGYEDWVFRLDLRMADGTTDIVLLEPEGEERVWNVQKQHLVWGGAYNGKLTAQIRAEKDGQVKKSRPFQFQVAPSVRAEEGMAVKPSELEQAEQRMQTLLAAGQAARDGAQQAGQAAQAGAAAVVENREAAESACTAAESAAESAGSAAQQAVNAAAQAIRLVSDVQDRFDSGTPGPQGPAGPKGETGAAGPNQITGGTATPFNGLLKGNGATVETAVPGTDYLKAETGAYTPYLSNGHANVGCTYEIQRGQYYRIGKLCFFSVRLKGIITQSGQNACVTLPFPPDISQVQRFCFALGEVVNAADQAVTSAETIGEDNRAIFFLQNGGKIVKWNMTGESFWFQASGCYITQ